MSDNDLVIGHATALAAGDVDARDAAAILGHVEVPASVVLKPSPKRAKKVGLKIVKAAPAVSVKSAASEAALSDRAAAKAAAAAAVAAYYDGPSLPFKAAVDLKFKAPLNFSGADNPTKRNAAACAAILVYCDVGADGMFVRGSGKVPGALIGRTGEDAKRLLAAGPESGTISGMLGREIHYVSGVMSGAGAEDQVFRLDFDKVESMFRQFNDKLSDGNRLFTGPLRLLGSLRRKAAPAA